jgi:hypothetical protein
MLEAAMTIKTIATLTSVFFVMTGFRANMIEFLDLLDGLVIERDDVLAANICSSVLLQKQQLISNDGQASKDCLLPGVPRSWYHGCIHAEVEVVARDGDDVGRVMEIIWTR